MPPFRRHCFYLSCLLDYVLYFLWFSSVARFRSPSNITNNRWIKASSEAPYPVMLRKLPTKKKGTRCNSCFLPLKKFNVFFFLGPSQNRILKEGGGVVVIPLIFPKVSPIFPNGILRVFPLPWNPLPYKTTTPKIPQWGHSLLWDHILEPLYQKVLPTPPAAIRTDFEDVHPRKLTWHGKIIHE